MRTSRSTTTSTRRSSRARGKRTPRTSPPAPARPGGGGGGEKGPAQNPPPPPWAHAAERAAKAKADQTRPPLQAAKDFVAEAKKLGLRPIETTMARVDRVAGLAAPDPLEEAAFGLSIGGTSAPVATPVGLVVLKSVEAIAAGVPPLAEIKDKVAASVKRQKAETTALERAKQLATDAHAGDFGAVAKKAG